jgi:hypothetical protein
MSISDAYRQDMDTLSEIDRALYSLSKLQDVFGYDELTLCRRVLEKEAARIVRAWD